MMNNKNRLVVILSIAGAGLVLAIGTAFFARGAIKEWLYGYRAERLINQAEIAFSEENWAEAVRKGTAAFYLQPDNKNNTLLVARGLLKQRQIGAIRWWKLALDHPDLPPDELREITAALFVLNRIDEGLLFLNRLVEIDGDNPETRHLWFSVLRTQARFTSSLNLAASMIGEGTDEWRVHEHYIAMQEALSGDEGSNLAIAHLVKLIDNETPLALHAARELVTRSSCPVETRLKAASYIRQHSTDPIDRLYAISVSVREGDEDQTALTEILQDILEDPQAAELAQLLRWSRWMGRREWFLDNVTYEQYVSSDEDPDAYLELMVDTGYNQRLIDLAERLGPEGGNNTPVFLYYRAVAWQNLGDAEQAENTLALATEVVDPADSARFEQYLLQDQRSDLLQRLYENQLQEDPENPQTLQKLAYVHYLLGDQDALESLLGRIDLTNYAGNPSAIAFMLYLKLLLSKNTDDIHKEISAYFVRYPELYEFRLLMGISHRLHGQPELALQFAQDMPPLNPNSPKFLRVCAVLLGKDRREHLSLSEEKTLLPRERLLLSQVSS